MIKIKETSNLFLTSDSHFNHANIIKFCNRPFDSVEEMNETLISNWNNTVPKDGIVFHLGDFAFGGSEAWHNILSRLNGKIYLILGNHDHKNFKQGYFNKFEDVAEQMTIEAGKKKLILTHFPLLCYNRTWNTGQNCWNIHGHVHICHNKLANTGKDFERISLTFPTQYDAGVDLNDYTPISFDKLRSRIQYQIDNNTNELYWIE